MRRARATRQLDSVQVAQHIFFFWTRKIFHLKNGTVIAFSPVLGTKRFVVRYKRSNSDPVDNITYKLEAC